MRAAIALARDGFETSEFYNSRAKAVIKRLKDYPQTAEIYLQQGEIPKAGYVLKQPELAKVLESISEHGADGFYTGEVAEKLISSVCKPGAFCSIKI